MKNIFVGMMTALALSFAAPLLAQDSGGTPPLTKSSAVNAPLSGTLLLPGSKSSMGSDVRTDKARYVSGQPIQIVFTVKNATKSKEEYDFPSGQQYDFSARNADGKEVWRWSKGRMFTQSLTHLSLAPGQHATFRGEWDGRDLSGKPVPPGAYTISARLPFNNRPAITGGVIVSRDTDPQNMGFPTRSPIETGAVRQVNSTPPVSASTIVTIGH